MPASFSKVIAWMGLLHVAAGLVFHASDVSVRNAGYILAHGIAFFFCVKVALDYPAGAPLRGAWLLFSCESLCMGTRSALVLALSQAVVNATYGVALISLGALFMVAGMLTTGIALHRMGFSFKLRRADILAMLLLTVSLPLTVILRYGWPLDLPWSSATTITIFLTAIVSIPLLRFSRQMGNAILARVNICIVTYMTVRCLYHVLSAMSISGTSPSWAEGTRYVIGYAAAWIFAYAAALRYDSVRHANRRLLCLVSYPSNQRAEF